MKIKEARFEKQIKVGLPSFSNLTLGFGMTVELAEGEELNTAECWDHVNHELFLQTSGIEPSWITSKDYRNFFKIVVKTAKNIKGGELKNGMENSSGK